MTWWVLALSACNSAPVDYSPDDRAQGAKAPWGHPTEVVCDGREPSDDDRLVDGFTYCGFAEALLLKWPVDDPVFERCADLAGSPLAVMSVTDGSRARAYAIDALDGREVVNDRWGDDPLLVDY